MPLEGVNTMRHSIMRWLVVSAGLGLVAPIVWFLAQTVISASAPVALWLEHITLVVWPTSVWLMATDGIEGTPRDYFFVSLAVAANVVLYALLGIGGWWIKHLAGFARR